jgi:hypothetical protein
MTEPHHHATSLDAAVSYAHQGIPVLPYQFFDRKQDSSAAVQHVCACRRRDCPAPPLLEAGRLDAQASARQMTYATRWWTANPDAGIATLAGTAFDVIEIHSVVPPGRILECLADDHVPLGPVLHAGDGRVQLFAKPNSYQADRIDSATAVILYLPAGSLIQLPPSRLPNGKPVNWLRPLDAHATLPDGADLFWAVAELPANRQPPDPRQYAFPIERPAG